MLRSIADATNHNPRYHHRPPSRCTVLHANDPDIPPRKQRPATKSTDSTNLIRQTRSELSPSEPNERETRRRRYSKSPTTRSYEVMKLLLLAALGCVCSAHREPSSDDYHSFEQIRRHDDVDDDNYRTDRRWLIDREKLADHVQTLGSRSRNDEEWYVDRDDRIGRRVHRYRLENPETHHLIRHGRRQFRSMDQNAHPQINWPVKKEAVVEGDLVLGGLMMVHEREDTVTCGPVMPQGGVQALEAMLYTLDKLNEDEGIVPGVKIGAHILDDCDKDTYGLEMAVDFIKGK
ncbi:uncharacterized protein LOC122538315 [Frieseomelitta varia]|uniref:uncharacterized protein LOC122538315 n=1 Tax=Frieseomelitta varia TaxID=561572 RepID=UPI001CB6ACBF|nr:uncharacterized protein LOC122538315 [Frieseomelitta varia]